MQLSLISCLHCELLEMLMCNSYLLRELDFIRSKELLLENSCLFTMDWNHLDERRQRLRLGVECQREVLGSSFRQLIVSMWSVGDCTNKGAQQCCVNIRCLTEMRGWLISERCHMLGWVDFQILLSDMLWTLQTLRSFFRRRCKCQSETLRSFHWGLDYKPHRKSKKKTWNHRLIQLAWISSWQLIMWLSSLYGFPVPVCTPNSIWANLPILVSSGNQAARCWAVSTVPTLGDTANLLGCAALSANSRDAIPKFKNQELSSLQLCYVYLNQDQCYLGSVKLYQDFIGHEKSPGLFHMHEAAILVIWLLSSLNSVEKRRPACVS